VRGSLFPTGQNSGSVAGIVHLVGPPVFIQGGIVVRSTWRGLGGGF
jgi:hypothetical protein